MMPQLRIIAGLVLGVGLLAIVAIFVNLPVTLRILRDHLTTPQGIMLALFASCSFVLAFSFRAFRWKLFLQPVGQVRMFRVLQLFLIGVFLNFLLPLRIGEVVKSLLLKRTEQIPLSRSLPTIAMDKVMDLLPALFVLSMVPLLGLRMNPTLWFVLGLAGSGLVGFFSLLGLTAWKRDVALRLVRLFTGLLPSLIGEKIETFVISCIDALLLSARQPRVFLAALVLTAIGVLFDGLYNMFSFWAIGYHISFGAAVFGYMTFNLFYILPNPPGQVGSNEVVGLLIFTGLLQVPAKRVIAMMLFFHPWSGLLMSVMGMSSLSAMGVTLPKALSMRTES